VTRTNNFKKYVVFDIETEGLHPWHNDRITCICAKDSDSGIFSKTDEDESQLIQDFLEWVYKRNSKEYRLVTHNGDCFDIPFILTRAVLHGFNKAFLNNIFAFNHFDLAKISGKRISLNNLAKLFCCKQKTGSGRDAIRLWKEKRFEALTKYCMNDVEVTEQVYLKHLNLVKDTF